MNILRFIEVPIPCTKRVSSHVVHIYFVEKYSLITQFHVIHYIQPYNEKGIH